MATLNFDQIVFANHPYSRPEEGYIETIQNISVTDLVQFQQKYYGPKGMVIVIVGAIDPQMAVDLITRYLGNWEIPNNPHRFAFLLFHL